MKYSARLLVVLREDATDEEARERIEMRRNLVVARQQAAELPSIERFSLNMLSKTTHSPIRRMGQRTIET